MRLTLLTLALFGLAVVHGDESALPALRGFAAAKAAKRWEQCGVLGERKEVPLKTRIVHGEDSVWLEFGLGVGFGLGG